METIPLNAQYLQVTLISDPNNSWLLTQGQIISSAHNDYLEACYPSDEQWGGIYAGKRVFIPMTQITSIVYLDGVDVERLLTASQQKDSARKMFGSFRGW